MTACKQTHNNGLCLQIDRVLPAMSTLATDAAEETVRIAQKMVWRIQEDTTQRLKSFASGEVKSCWPPLGYSVLMQQLSVLYSSSDFRHGVIGPMLMSLCRTISQCPVTNTRDLAKGSLLCCIILNITEKTCELIPELQIFVTNALESLSRHQVYSATELDAVLLQTDVEFSHNIQEVSWTAFSEGNVTAEEAARVEDKEGLSSLYLFFKMVKCMEVRYGKETYFADMLNKIHKFCSCNEKWNSFVAKCGVEPFSSQGPVIYQPLQWRQAQKKVDKSLAPAFDLHYTMKKVSASADADVEKLKALRRQMKREKKASMRELRKDSMFLGAEAYREQTQRKNDLKEERAKNFTWLQDEHASFNQQVRMGKVEMKGGGTNGLKAERKKRTNKKSK